MKDEERYYSFLVEVVQKALKDSKFFSLLQQDFSNDDNVIALKKAIKSISEYKTGYEKKLIYNLDNETLITGKTYLSQLSYFSNMEIRNDNVNEKSERKMSNDNQRVQRTNPFPPWDEPHIKNLMK